jgi:ribonuclease P protein subunit RPR2
MKRTRSISPERVKIAKERIDILFKLAEKELKKNPKRSRRYIELARRIGMRCNVRLTPEQRRNFCKKCNQLLIPKKTCIVEVNSQGKLIKIKCLNCGFLYRKPYVKKI